MNPYLLGYKFADLDNDKIPESVLAKYDLNKNGKSDVTALYFIKYIDNKGHVVTNENAYGILIDKNEDGINDYGLIDKNKDGKLETKIKLKDVQFLQNQNKNKLKRKYKNYV